MKFFFILILIAGIGRGSSFLFIYLGIEEAHPITVITYRLVFAAIAALVYLIIIRQHFCVLSTKYLKRAAPLSLLGLVIPFYAVAYAELSVETAVAGVMTSAVPVITSIILLGIYKQKPKFPLLMILGFLGVMTIYLGDFSKTSFSDTLHISLIVVSLICYALHNIIVSNTPDLNKSILACISIIAGSLISLFVHTVIIGSPLQVTSFEFLLNMVILGVFCTTIPLVALFIAITNYGSVMGSYGAYIIPIVALLLGFIVLDETISYVQALGGFLILGSIYFQGYANSKSK